MLMGPCPILLQHAIPEHEEKGNYMKKTMPLLVLLVIICLTCVHCGSRAGQEGELQIGSSAPSFELSDLRGQTVSLSQFKGKIVILDFWATWCGPCRLSMPLLEKLQKENPNDLKLLAINLEEPLDLVRDYVARQNINTTVLLDSEGKVGRIYGSESIPMQVLIDKKGIIRDVKVGFSPSMGEQLRKQLDQLRAD
jgi:thiol-disulfide isomerase/thioredoxin